MMMEVDDEWLDGFAITKLLRDYNYLTCEITNFEVEDGFLLDYELEDLKAAKKTRKAIKTVLKYYLGENWKEKL